jgi:hypothetical protein
MIRFGGVEGGDESNVYDFDVDSGDCIIDITFMSNLVDEAAEGDCGANEDFWGSPIAPPF